MIKVTKRNGKVVDFDITKIERAVVNAIDEISCSINHKDILRQIEIEIKNSEKDTITVEEIQEIVVAELYTVNRELGKVYNDYRNKKNQKRELRKGYKLLSEEFLSKYKHLPDPFKTDMNSFVFYRTYSRYLPEENRRERWWEVVARVVEYNCNLAPTTVKEAERLYDNIYNLRQFPSGRSLWVGGTEVSKKYPMSNFSCAFSIINDFSSFVECFYLLLIGSGVGLRILPEDVEKLPSIRTDIEIVDKYYEPISKSERKELTEVSFNGSIAKITIGDSKEAWVQALSLFLKLHYESFYKHIDTIMLCYDNIRPKGERLKTFGGYASGHESIQIMLNKISKVIKDCPNKVNKNYAKLRPIDCLDISNILGENVVSGGVRRTAENALCSVNEKQVIEAKTGLYKLVAGKWIIDKDIAHRTMSNNSIFYEQKPTREQLHWQLEQMRYSGEPGFLNAEQARKRRIAFNGVNPCFEILLDDKGMCNLTEIVPLAFVIDGVLDEKALYEAQYLSARMGYRMTCVDFELHRWDYINKRDRLTGCSITGWQDFINELSLSKEEQIRILSNLKEVAIKATEDLAKQLGFNAPVLHTTNKPSGTISLLANVSAGVHYSHSEYFIRRVRINAFDPLAMVLKELGYNWNPEIGQTRKNAKTIVIDFPAKSPKGLTKFDISAIEQLENYKMFMKYYADHNVSITVHVRKHEWEEVEQWVWDNWDDIVAISFLPLDDSMYELMPFEEITEEQYFKVLSETPKFNPSLLYKYEKGEEFELDESDCSSGICPIK